MCVCVCMCACVSVCECVCVCLCECVRVYLKIAKKNRHPGNAFPHALLRHVFNILSGLTPESFSTPVHET